jgi:hypothetical protein
LSSLVSIKNYPVMAREPPHGSLDSRHGSNKQLFWNAEISSCWVDTVAEAGTPEDDKEVEGVILREIGGLIRGRRGVREIRERGN